MIAKAVDSLVGIFSPHAQLRRMQARKVMRSYQGAESNRLTNNKKPLNRSADQELLGPFGADAMRAWARSLVRDNAYAWGVVDTIVSSVVGCGIVAQSTYETQEGDDVEDVNDARDKLFSEWCEVCDINGQHTFSEIQALCQREMVEAGEVLVRKINTKDKEHRGIVRPVPFALELIEADRLATDHDSFGARVAHSNENRIIRGVEVDQLGKPVAYWIYPDHPQQAYSFNRTPERIPANQIIHLFRRDRIGQTRGISWFAPALSWLRDLGVYVDNEIQASAVASCYTAFIHSDTPVGSLTNPNGDDTTDINGNQLEYLEPGIITRIGTNEKIDFANPGRPNSASEPWINLMLRGIAVGTGLSYESVSKDFSNTSYSSSRSAKLEDKPKIERWQKSMVSHLCYPVWDAFCDAAAISGNEDFPTSAELLDDRRKFAPVEWQTPARPWVDPESEQTAAESSIKSFMSDYQTEMGSRGLSWRWVFYQRAKEEKLRKKLGLFTPEEQTQQMMAAQTANNQPQAIGGTADATQPSVAGGTGEMADLSRLQWQRNRKAIEDILDGLADKSMSPAKATALLSTIGMSQTTIDALIADASDGMIDTSLPTEDQVTRSIVYRGGPGSGPQGGDGSGDSSSSESKSDRIEGTSKELSSEQAKVSSQVKELKSKIEKAEKAGKQVESLKVKASAADAKVDAIKAKLEASRSRIAALKSQLSPTKRAKEDGDEKTLDQELALLEELQEQLKAIQSEIDEMESELSDAEVVANVA